MSEPDSFDRSILESAGYTEEEIDNYFKEMEEDIVEPEKCICIDGCKHLLPSKLPNINEIEFLPQPKFLAFKYNKKDLVIKTPRIFVPFGIDKYYEHWSINFQLKNLGCIGIKEFKEFLTHFEKKMIELLETTNDKLNSQLNISNNIFKFYGRIKNEYNKPSCEIKDKRKYNLGTFVNIHKFPKDVWVQAHLTTNGLWKMNDIYCYKYHVKKIDIVD